LAPDNKNLAPLVSIVIPCRNEQDFIGECIYSVLQADYPKDLLEVYVCDGKSDDRTVEVVENIIGTNPNVHVLINEFQTTPYALNLGIREAKSEVIIILGAHSKISKGYISKCVKALAEDTSIGCVGGVLDNLFSDGKSEAIAHAMSHPFGVGSAHFRTGQKSGYVDTVAFGAYRKEVFDKVGLFDETLTRNQDDEFNYRLVQFGYRIKLDTSIKSSYFVRAAYGKLFKQYYQYGYWKVFVNRKYKSITSFRQVVPALFVLYIILGLLVSSGVPQLFPLYMIGLASYVVLGLISALSKSSHPVKALMIFYAFILLHLSYGTGYWTGLFSFILMGYQPKPGDTTSSR